MTNEQKVREIMNALNMRDEVKDDLNPMVMRHIPTITGDDRKALIAELVKLLTTPETT